MIDFSDNFLIELKKLSKKFRQIKTDLKKSIQEIENDSLGISIGNHLYKKRVPNSSIPTGKRGGFRIIIFHKLQNRITLVSIYSKTDKENLTDYELKKILEEVKFI